MSLLRSLFIINHHAPFISNNKMFFYYIYVNFWHLFGIKSSKSKKFSWHSGHLRSGIPLIPTPLLGKNGVTWAYKIKEF
jgi:hypothetical protein